MSKLEDYYRLFDMFKGNLTESQKDVLGQLEDQIIAEEILPAISESVAPVLNTLRRNLTMIVDYDTKHGVTVKTTRGEVVVKENTAKSYNLPSPKGGAKEDDTNTNENNGKEDSGITRSESIGFSVKFKDGSVIERKDAQLTMIATLKAVGLDKVAKFNGRLFKGYPLVGRVKREDGTHRWQVLVEGWYIYVNMSNETKIKMLNMISDEFGLDLVIKNKSEGSHD